MVSESNQTDQTEIGIFLSINSDIQPDISDFKRVNHEMNLHFTTDELQCKCMK